MALNILRRVQGENMGDHGETTTQAIEVDPLMTVLELAEAYLSHPYLVHLGPDGRVPEPWPEAYLTIRVTMPIPKRAEQATDGEAPF